MIHDESSLTAPTSTHETCTLSFPLEELLNEEALLSQQEYDRYSADERRATKRAAQYLARGPVHARRGWLPHAREPRLQRKRLACAATIVASTRFTLPCDAMTRPRQWYHPTSSSGGIPVGYGHSVGEALQNTTRVHSVLNVDLPNLVPAILDPQHVFEPDWCFASVHSKQQIVAQLLYPH
jgi:hypothetical protein